MVNSLNQAIAAAGAAGGGQIIRVPGPVEYREKKVYQKNDIPLVLEGF